jgi:multidrug efflux system membrane fusion protein
LLASVFVYGELYRHPRTDDAYVRANVVGIAAHVSGPIVELPVVDNQPVKQGDLLFVVDPRPYEAMLEKARAELLLTDREIAGYERAISAAEAVVRQRQVDERYAADYLARLVPLLAKQYVTADQVDEARTRKRAAEAALERAEAERGRAIADLGQVGDVNARRRAKEAAVRDAELNVGYCTVRAPFDGLVTNLNIAVGQYANAGVEIFALVDARNWYVLANFKETYLKEIAIGDTAEVYLMGYPGHRFRGVVQGIGWALYQDNGSSVGVLPQVAPTLNWVRLAQRFPVRILLQPSDAARPYRMGATAVVTIRDDPEDERARSPARDAPGAS